MGKNKKYKKQRTKVEKGNDHRNEGYTAVEALYEHNAEHSKNIYPPIITKVGLKEYTDEEIAEKSGRVVSYNYNNRYSWQEFKAMPEQNKREYLKHLMQKYPGVRATDFAMMFGLKAITVFTNEAKKVGIFFPKTGKYNTDNRKAFKRDMLDAEIAEPERIPEPEPVPIEEPETEKVVIEEPMFSVHRVSLICDAKRAGEVLTSLGITGRVTITAEITDRKEVV